MSHSLNQPVNHAAVLETKQAFGETTLIVDPARIVDLCRHLKDVEKYVRLSGITAVDSRRHFTRVISEHGVAFARGTRVEMEFDEEQFIGAGVYLFASVLEKFFGLYVSMNSFSQLVARSRQRKEPLGEWPPRAGQSVLI